ncbi:hypothetical protein ACQJBY_063842 [Aegilops geniculata]
MMTVLRMLTGSSGFSLQRRSQLLRMMLSLEANQNHPRKNRKHAGDKKGKTIKHDISVNKVKIVEIKSKLDSNEMSGAAINLEEHYDEESINIDASSDSSLERYDLSDDDTDLQKNFTHLSDLAAALGKHEDLDGG